MSMLSLQCEEMRKLAEIARGYAESNQRRNNRNLLLRCAHTMSEAADTIEYLRDKLEDSCGQVSEQGERESYSRWRKLFETPEQAAKTLACINCVPLFDFCKGCSLEKLCDKYADYDKTLDEVILEWLREEDDADTQCIND